MAQSEAEQERPHRGKHRKNRSLVLLGAATIIGSLLFGYTSTDGSNSASAAITDPVDCPELLSVSTSFAATLVDEVEKIDSDLKIIIDEGPTENATSSAFRLIDVEEVGIPEFRQQESILSTDQESLACDEDADITANLEDIGATIDTIDTKLNNTENDTLVTDVISAEEDGYDPCDDTATIQSAPLAAGSDANSDNADQNARTLAGTVVKVDLSEGKYPESAQHIKDAIAAGKAKVLTVNRKICKENRKASLKPHKNLRAKGKDRDEYPFAMTDEGGAGASVRLISASDNRGAGSTIGNALRGQPDGTQFEINIVP